MKTVYCIAAGLFLLPFMTPQKGGTSVIDPGTTKTWQLVFNDEFNSKGSIDVTKWSFCERGHPAWAKFLTPGPDYAFLDGHNLVVRMDNQPVSGDSAAYHSGGIQTKGKFSFLYGRVEVRARFSGGKGSWPAIWMMPEKDTWGAWPRSGEIDIMEHVNNERVIHQTIHNASVTGADGGSKATASSPYKAGDYNLYGLIWKKDRIEFYLNDSLTYTYYKTSAATSREWPFDQPFYLILNQSGGAGWPGPLHEGDLPFSMQVDWVRVYSEK